MVDIKLNSNLEPEKLRCLNARDLLDFMSDGRFVVDGDGFVPVTVCDCGKVPVFVHLKITNRRFYMCDCRLSFLCDDCFRSRFDVKKG